VKQHAAVTQTRVGLAILLALAAIGAALLLQQYRYDPQRFRLGIVPGALSGPDDGLVLPPGAIAVSPQERFDSTTLSDKIDGRADLYLAAGFQGLRCRRFAATLGDPDVVEACVYDLGSPQNAYSAWSQQRRTGAPDALIGPHSYAVSNGLFVATGRFYLEILAARGGASALALARSFAGAFASANAGDGSAAAQGALLPAEGRVDGTEALLATSAFGLDGFDRVHIARYRIQDKEATAFVCSRGTPEEAAALAAAWRDALVAQGAVAIAAPTGIPGAWALDAAGWTEIAFTRGTLVAGIHEADSRSVADALAASLWTTLEKASP
jgi:hypothetical protein